MIKIHKGSCLCKSIQFEIAGVLPEPIACHCTQCRKHSGHFEVGTDVNKTTIIITGKEQITWFSLPNSNVRRGFCSKCGSSLFWDPTDKEWIGVCMGAFDTPTNTKIKLHAFVKNKGDYYELNDNIPQFDPIEVS